jgi:high affinity Mn2+ porin
MNFLSQPLLCVARTSLGDAIKQHLPCYFFQLRMTCNKAWEWVTSPLDSDRTGGIDGFIPFSWWWQRAGIKAVDDERDRRNARAGNIHAMNRCNRHWERVFAGVGLSLLVLDGPAIAADLPLKAPASTAADDWTGFYVGGHFGYATGTTNWTATDAGAAIPTLNGSFDVFNSYDAFKGTGSYFVGLQAGYNYMLPSRFLVGFEADVSAPNTLAGTQAISSAIIGQASYNDTVLNFGTARGRIGYAFDQWLLYGTGGVAWTYDKLTRTQLAGTPVAGTAVVGTTEAALLWRWGWAAGAGVEVPIGPNWTAKLEYLAAEFGGREKGFPASAQSFNTDLTLQNIRLGVNYQFGSDLSKNDAFTKGVPALDSDRFAVHGQTTLVSQYALPFRAPYSGQNSLASNSGRETFDVDLYLGFRPWQGAEIWVNPEIDQGFGLSGTFGVAGFPSAEAYKVGAAYPYARIPRAFLRQTIDLGGDVQKVDAGINQFAGSQTTDRLVITVGKFSVVDIFDTNKYAHDPRSDFLNWTMVDTGSFDYAADAWSFTYGGAVEWYTGQWTFRAGVFDGPAVPNSSNLDPTFGQFQMVGEIERRYDLWDQPGKIAVTGFLTRARMGNFTAAVQLAELTGAPADITAVRTYTSKTGIAANMEQQILSGVGLFVRAGYTPGNLETYAFTDADASFSGGTLLSGKFWGRPDDTVGIAGILNTITKTHEAYFADGGFSALIGDGMLPHPGPEKILEAYYSLPIYSWHLTFDYQFITNPAYNRDRGPVSVVASRLHAQF